jgi:hypothetical protein
VPYGVLEYHRVNPAWNILRRVQSSVGILFCRLPVVYWHRFLLGLVVDAIGWATVVCRRRVCVVESKGALVSGLELGHNYDHYKVIFLKNREAVSGRVCLRGGL